MLQVVVLQMIYKCASWVTFLVAALVVSWWTNWVLHCSCVPTSDALDDVPDDSLMSDRFPAGGGISVGMICLCGIGQKVDNEKKWKVLRNILLASSQNGIGHSQFACSTQDESCGAWLEVAGVLHDPAIGSTLV
jgi:hypothetical protein